MDQLKSFYNNKTLREALRQFMVENLKEITVDKAFKGETVGGIKEANECIIKSFDKLEELYGKIDEPIISNSR